MTPTDLHVVRLGPPVRPQLTPSPPQTHSRIVANAHTMTVPGPYPESLPSPVSSHSDSIGPPLSDLPSLASSHSVSSRSRHSHNEDDSDSFDMLSSREWNRSVSRFEQSTSGSEVEVGHPEERMRLSFPDPLAEVRGMEVDEAVGYSFLLDARPDKTRSIVEEVEPDKEGREEKQTYADVSSWIRTTSSITGESLEHLDVPPSPTVRCIPLTFVGGTTGERETVAARFKALSFNESCMAQAIIVQFVERGSMGREEEVRTLVSETADARVFPIISSRPASLVASTCNLTDSSTTIRDVPITSTVPDDPTLSRSVLRLDDARQYTTLDEFIQASDTDLLKMLRRTSAIASSENDKEDETTATCVDPDDTPPTPASLLSRTLLLITAAIFIATVSLLESTPTFAALRSPLSLSLPHIVPILSLTTSSHAVSPTIITRTPHTSACANSKACALALLSSHPTSLSIFASPSSVKSSLRTTCNTSRAKFRRVRRRERRKMEKMRRKWIEYRQRKVGAWTARTRTDLDLGCRMRLTTMGEMMGARIVEMGMRVPDLTRMMEGYLVASHHVGLGEYRSQMERWIRGLHRTKHQLQGIVRGRCAMVVDQIRLDWRKDFERIKGEIESGVDRVGAMVEWAMEKASAARSVVESHAEDVWTFVGGDDLKAQAERRASKAAKGWGRIKRSEVCWSWDGGFAVRR
jgi:hypothetical protein